MLDKLEARRNQLDEIHKYLIQTIDSQEEDDIYTILDRTSIQHPVPAVVLNFIEFKPIHFTARVYLTQVIKQELFSRTIPNYQPPSLQQQLSAILDIDLQRISDKQAAFLFNQLTSRYYSVESEAFDLDDVDDYYDDYGFYTLRYRLYEFDLTVLRFLFVSQFKNGYLFTK